MYACVPCQSTNSVAEASEIKWTMTLCIKALSPGSNPLGNNGSDIVFIAVIYSLCSYQARPKLLLKGTKKIFAALLAFCLVLL